MGDIVYNHRQRRGYPPRFDSRKDESIECTSRLRSDWLLDPRRPAASAIRRPESARQISGTHRSRRAADQRRAPGRAQQSGDTVGSADVIRAPPHGLAVGGVPRSLRRLVTPAGIAGPASSRGPGADVVGGGRDSALTCSAGLVAQPIDGRYRCYATASAFSAAASAPPRAGGDPPKRRADAQRSTRGPTQSLPTRSECSRGRSSASLNDPRRNDIPAAVTAAPTRPRGAVRSEHAGLIRRTTGEATLRARPASASPSRRACPRRRESRSRRR
ncbi:hypothetical protein APR08_000162 [Nocardia amikacinitolerans]|nr:hypothetical protein [Nocardia amikacinitolerans]